ncbi:MAG: TonB-dependent receptor, partial [Arcobacteraceae bacterium]
YGPGATAVSKGTLTRSSQNDEEINALYVEIQNSISSNLTSTINFRHDTLEYDYINKLDNSLNADPSYIANTYRIGFNYKINTNNNIYTSYATGFRAPTAEQISGNINKLQSDPSLDIDTNLEIETTNNIEVGVRGKSDSLNYDASIYQLDRENYIGVRAGNYMWDSDEDADKAVGNLGDMRSRGFELVLNNNDKRKTVSFSVAYTYLDAKFKEYSINPNDGKTKISLNGNTVPRTSKHTLNFALDFKLIEGLTLSPEIIAKSGFYADESNNYKQPGYEVVNLRSEYKVNESLELFGKIENLLNKDYNQFVNVGYEKNMEDATIRVAAPRAYYAGLRYKF